MIATQFDDVSLFGFAIFLEERTEHSPHLLHIPIRHQGIKRSVAREFVIDTWENVILCIGLAMLFQQS